MTATGRDRPALSVVIAATDSPPAVVRALETLRGQAPGQVEVIVVSSFCLPSAPGRGGRG